MLHKSAWILFFVSAALAKECTLESNNSTKSTCVTIYRCPSVLKAARLSTKEAEFKPQICEMDGEIPIVCCAEDEILASGARAEANCDKFRKLVPKKDVDAVYEQKTMRRASFDEFPHMVLLGYDVSHQNRSDGVKVQFSCAGVLISEKFVVTSAHCLYSKYVGFVKYIALRTHDRFNVNVDSTKLHQVFRVISHPNFKGGAHYHDVGLIELENPILPADAVPACLGKVSTETVKNIGWTIRKEEDKEDQMYEANSKVVDLDVCKKTFPKTNKFLENGLIDDHLCVEETGFCFGSGAALHTSNPKNEGYSVFGLASFGRTCTEGINYSVYSALYPHIDWMEYILWDENSQFKPPVVAEGQSEDSVKFPEDKQ